MTTHPYHGADARQLWPRAMAGMAPGLVDPVGGPLPRISRDDRVATLGSCFAQHLSRHLQRSGCHYHVAEPRPVEMDAAQATARQYGVFSCRYGNVYTVRQALQLLRRATGGFQPLATAWAHRGRWVDPFRPRVEPEGWAGPDEIEADRRRHLDCVRAMFEGSDWFVFTLGLTEAWHDLRDGAVFPLAPGVAGGRYMADEHAFVNFGIDEVRADLDALVTEVQALNPRARWLLTVSPVPLAATATPVHVWTATTYSKAVLRVAAEHAAQHHAQVHYFPSYEVITSPAAGGRYYADDLRQVTDMGVQHVMRLFSRHCLPADGAAPVAGPALSTAQDDDLVCDDDTVARALHAALPPR